MKSKFTALVLVCALSTGAIAQDDCRIVNYSALGINRTMAPRAIGDILQTTEATALAVAAGAYFGIDPKTAVGTVQVLANVLPTSSYAGEESRFNIDIPDGYAYCAAAVTVTSLAPYTGSRASVIGVTRTSENVSAYTWTPKQGLGGGRSWVEAKTDILAVKHRYLTFFTQQGVCAPDASARKDIISCRGNACGSVSDGNMSLAGAAVETAIAQDPALAACVQWLPN